MVARPIGIPAVGFRLGIVLNAELSQVIVADAADAMFAALLSYSEALKGLRLNNSSWCVIKLYYSAFFCIQAALLADEVIPFHCKEFYLYDAKDGIVRKGGKSSHDWNWKSIRDLKRLNGWYYSLDSNNAYEKLKQLREEANYKSGFLDPGWPRCLDQVSTAGIEKAFRTYRDDNMFLYTYLEDHLIMAYPTKLIFEIANYISTKGIKLENDRLAHLTKIWPFKDKLPLV